MVLTWLLFLLYPLIEKWPICNFHALTYVLTVLCNVIDHIIQVKINFCSYATYSS